MNKVIINGNITKDIEIRSTATGKHFTSFNIAVNEGSGENQHTDFFEINAWENNADFITKYFGKGRKILIEGTLKTSSYEKDGSKRIKTYILAQHVEFADSKKQEEKYEDFNDQVITDEMELPF